MMTFCMSIISVTFVGLNRYGALDLSVVFVKMLTCVSCALIQD